MRDELDGFSQVLEEFAADPEVRVVVLAGAKSNYDAALCKSWVKECFDSAKANEGEMK